MRRWRAAHEQSNAEQFRNHIDQLFPTRSSVTRLIAILQMSEQPGCLFISPNARACKSRIESRVFAIRFVVLLRGLYYLVLQVAGLMIMDHPLASNGRVSRARNAMGPFRFSCDRTFQISREVK
jgi:hypothetical protein